MTIQYNRKLSIVVANTAGQGIEFSTFKVRFSIRRGDVQTPNSADIRIYNVSPETANQISTKEFNQVVVQAGYEGNFGLIFRGQTKQVRIGRENAVDSYVDITAADGDSAYNFSSCSFALAAGQTPQNAVERFLKTMGPFGITKGYLPPDLSNAGRIRGRVFYGMTKDELRDFAAANEVLYSIQDGALNVVSKRSYIPGDPVIISPQTGLIGVPEQTQNGIEARILLNPQVRISRLVKLENTTINLLRYGLDKGSQANNAFLAKSVNLDAKGYYYVMSADHTGDTRSTNWYTDLTLLAVDAEQVPVSAVSRSTVAPAATAIRLN